MTALPDFSPVADQGNLRAQSMLCIKRLQEHSLFPFTGTDSSVGMEYELQVAVIGSRNSVDLPLTLRQSRLFRNIEKRACRGDLPQRNLLDLEDFLNNNPSRVWENSWVRFEEHLLGPFASQVLATDFLADKQRPTGAQRQDLERFRVQQDGKSFLRLPISYLLKLALACLVEPSDKLPLPLQRTGQRLLDHFVSDNTSPEILSLTVPRATAGRIGLQAARETARTFLVAQLLCQYANVGFGLAANGQRCLIYNAPHAPLRQKRLNELVPDGYYRHLFMSPCLSGWDRGEEKQRYMSLCHQTLSRSQLNTLAKLKDAGIITNNLVVLPNTSNTCLANNGTHVSLGSRLLTAMAPGNEYGFTSGVEKHLGDLVIKIVEHFLPLLVGTYTAAPYRIDFADFHPEKVLGFLPHELDYTHLRMLWRRWKKKADIRFLGKPFTPFGPRQLDRFLARVLGLHGDLIADFRLIDYFITLLSTDTAPALNGMVGNQEILKNELAELGIFDSRMSIYLPYRMRAFSTMGYSGFEGRSYSLFPSFLGDMAEAVDLQNLITAFAYRLVLDGRISHADIPDEPFIESERRQIFFASAIGVPTVFIRENTGNRLLREILSHVRHQRPSRRYRNSIRVKVHDLRLALVDYLSEAGRDTVELLAANQQLANLRERLQNPDLTAYHKIIEGSAVGSSWRRPAKRLPAEEVNSATESHYRNSLRLSQMAEGYAVLQEDCTRLEKEKDQQLAAVMTAIDPSCSPVNFLLRVQRQIMNEDATSQTIRQVLYLALATIHADRTTAKSM